MQAVHCCHCACPHLSPLSILNASVPQPLAHTPTQVHEQPLMLAVADFDNLLEDLQMCNQQLDIVEKGLNDFLDTKKMAFPRCVPDAQKCLIGRHQEDGLP